MPPRRHSAGSFSSNRNKLVPFGHAIVVNAGKDSSVGKRDAY